MKPSGSIINQQDESQLWVETSPEKLPVGYHKPDVWFQRARRAETVSEALVCLNQVFALDPQNTQAQEMRYRVVWRLLEADPFLAYQEETDNLYRVWSNMNLELIVPKGRAVVESYPPTTKKPLAPAFGWLRWTLIGLLPAGLGALFLAPITAARTLLISLNTPLNKDDQLRVIVILFLTAVLWIAALLLSFLFLLHLIP